MFRSIFEIYKKAFVGLSAEIWLLSLATFINRAGTMVVPFIALYLTEDLKLTLTQVGWVMTCFGLGSMVGAYLGGKLSDVFSFYKVMVGTLFLSGIAFIFLFHVKSFYGFCVAIFILMIIADSFRPAIFAAISAYSKPENRVRSISLVRLAINLGFSLGPAAGGILIYYLEYHSLFIIDGITCISAAVTIMLLLSPKKRKLVDDKTNVITKDTSPYDSVWKDKPYLLMMVMLFIVDLVFIQLFANVPLFYREVHHLTEKTIGLLLAMNGVIIFLFEMPLVSIIDGKGIHKLKVLMISILLMGFSYVFLNFGVFLFILVLSMVLITIGEMLGFPFSNSFALDRAPKNKVGTYMGLYTIAFSASHVIGPNVGLRISDHYGFAVTWYIMGMLSLIAALICIVLYKMIQAEHTRKALNRPAD